MSYVADRTTREGRVDRVEIVASLDVLPSFYVCRLIDFPDHDPIIVHEHSLSNWAIMETQRDLFAANIFDDVEEFHRHHKINYSGPPRRLPDDLKGFRQRFLEEELTEYRDATSLADQLDALIDLIYVAAGTIHLHGFNGPVAWKRVHAANMKKRLSAPGDDARHASDVVKPDGWIPPALDDLVKEDAKNVEPHKPQQTRIV